MSLLRVLALLSLALQLVACGSSADCGPFRMLDRENDLCVCRPEYTPVGDLCVPNDEVDAGMDAGTDSSVDAPMADGMIEACSEPEDCPARVNASATCESMACAYECDEDWGDCDGDPTNGCETDLTSTESHCDVCDRSCGVDELCFERVCAQEPMLDWSRSFGDVSTEQAYGVAIATDGITHVVSTYTDSFPPTIDGRTLGTGGMMVLALSDEGDVIRVMEEGGNASVFPLAVATDADANLFVVGSFSNDAEFGGTGHPSGGDSDAFVVSYDSAGAHRWTWTTRAAASQSFNHVAVDDSGFVTVAGYFGGMATFGPFPAQIETSNGELDGVLVSYSNTGSTRWVSTYGDAANDFLAATSSPDGTVYAGGTFAGEVQLDDDVSRTSEGTTNAFVFEATSTGAYQWDSVPSNSEASVVHRLAARAGGGVIAAGEFLGTVRFGDEELASVGTTSDLFVVAFGSAGEVEWAQRIGGTGAIFPIVGLATGDDGAIYVTGSFNGRIGVGGTSVFNDDIADDGFVVSLDASGSLRWIRAFGGPGEQAPRDVAAVAGRLVVAGYFSGEIEAADLNATGGQDAFVLSFRIR